MSGVEGRFFKWLMWIAMFVVSSQFLVNYENLANYGNLNAEGYVMITSHSVNLFNEGPIGYAALALICFSGFMYCKEFLNFQKSLCSFSHARDGGLVSEVKNIE